ncbi:hypothetical protein VOLCADRAFT_93642 [Volvox carteri f. nagariensis]|uniref:Uncharacterized protein n=1 Tax=Volvox carteri f. nagariensis TaxID=3068 RepID=D8U2M9_VOLCA|nr:uncharacterized protein VOLCADRAFT_93642 [Volvox carteri f. nagariensis]EFJ45837.1 hypothetical protein VOLCADRAFT_93642 [Volvox carteri f. nagariensis]|eukprot:XP_002952915.1 hypothetical protein VOLCADRAFT_93642 [Volvox carteri f. nagariensis]
MAPLHTLRNLLFTHFLVSPPTQLLVYSHHYTGRRAQPRSIAGPSPTSGLPCCFLTAAMHLLDGLLPDATVRLGLLFQASGCCRIQGSRSRIGLVAAGCACFQTTWDKAAPPGCYAVREQNLLVLALWINATQTTGPRQLRLGASLHESIPPGAGLADKRNTNYRPKAAPPGCYAVREQNLLVLALWINATQTTGPRQLRLGASLHESKTLLVLALWINTTQSTGLKQLCLSASLRESIPPGAGLPDKRDPVYRPKATQPGCFTTHPLGPFGAAQRNPDASLPESITRVKPISRGHSLLGRLPESSCYPMSARRSGRFGLVAAGCACFQTTWDKMPTHAAEAAVVEDTAAVVVNHDPEMHLKIFSDQHKTWAEMHNLDLKADEGQLLAAILQWPEQYKLYCGSEGSFHHSFAVCGILVANGMYAPDFNNPKLQAINHFTEDMKSALLSGGLKQFELALLLAGLNALCQGDMGAQGQQVRKRAKSAASNDCSKRTKHTAQEMAGLLEKEFHSDIMSASNFKDIPEVKVRIAELINKFGRTEGAATMVGIKAKANTTEEDVAEELMKSLHHKWKNLRNMAKKTQKEKGDEPTPAQQGAQSYRMEDWLHFVETFSSYIFKGDVLPEALRALCWSLCSTVTHYFWPRPPDETREQFLVAAKAAACKLRAYTTRLEELEVPGYMFTVNLHICVCWLYSDLPVERMMQQMKTQGGRMVSQAPEKHYAQWLCLMRASESLTEADPRTGAKHTTNQQLERMLARRAVNTEAAWFDKPGANGYLLGRGHMVYPSPERVAQVRAAMASLVHWYALAFEDVASWTLGPSASYELDTDRLDRVLMSTPPDCPKARSLLHAEALDEEQYFGAEYGRQQQRISCWACYQAEVGNKTRTYAAYLKHFVHLPAEDGAQDVRFTVADVYSGQVFSEGLVVVNMAAAQTARAGSQWEMWQDLGLPLSHLICRLKASLCMALYKTGGPARSLLHAEALDEEQYFGAEYGRQQQRISCWACYQAEVGNKTRTYAAYLKHFVHLPAEDGAQDVRFTVADVYSGQVFSEGLVVVNMAAAQTARAGSQWEMWQDLGLPLSELKGKFCTAAPEGDRKGLMYFMPYTHFTNR